MQPLPFLNPLCSSPTRSSVIPLTLSIIILLLSYYSLSYIYIYIYLTFLTIQPVRVSPVRCFAARIFSTLLCLHIAGRSLLHPSFLLSVSRPPPRNPSISFWAFPPVFFHPASTPSPSRTFLLVSSFLHGQTISADFSL